MRLVESRPGSICLQAPLGAVCGKCTAALVNKCRICGKQFKDLLLFRYKIDVENRDIYDLIKNARPPIHFKRQDNIQNALKIWKNDAIMHVLSYLQKQTMQARLNTKLQNIIVQKTCLNLAKYAQQHSI